MFSIYFFFFMWTARSGPSLFFDHLRSIFPQSYNFNMLQLLLDGATWSWPFESLLSSRRYCFRGMSLLFPRMSLLMSFLFCLLSIDPFLHFLNRPIFFIFQSSRSKRNKDFAIAGIRTFNLRVSRQILTPGTTVPRLFTNIVWLWAPIS